MALTLENGTPEVMSELGSIHHAIGELSGRMAALMERFDGVETRFEDRIDRVESHFNKECEQTTARLNAHATDIRGIRSDIDSAKGNFQGSKTAIGAMWLLGTSLMGLIGWLVLNAPSFTGG